MSSEENNPYPDDKPDLQAAWDEGHATGERNESIPKGRIYDEDDKEQAWIEGYMEGQMAL